MKSDTFQVELDLRRKAIPIFDDTNIYEIVKNHPEKLYCVLVDEVQFLKKEHVLQLTKIVDELRYSGHGLRFKK